MPYQWSPSPWVLSRVATGAPAAASRVLDRLEQRCGEARVPERVDEQALPVADDEPGVRLAEAAVRLQPRPGALGDLDEAAVEERLGPRAAFARRSPSPLRSQLPTRGQAING